MLDLTSNYDKSDSMGNTHVSLLPDHIVVTIMNILSDTGKSVVVHSNMYKQKYVSKCVLNPHNV